MSGLRHLCRAEPQQAVWTRTLPCSAEMTGQGWAVSLTHVFTEF